MYLPNFSILRLHIHPLANPGQQAIQLADLFGVTVDYLLGRQEVEDSTLSEYEIQLLIASRKADERAKEDALNMLMAHAIDTSK